MSTPTISEFGNFSAIFLVKIPVPQAKSKIVASEFYVNCAVRRTGRTVNIRKHYRMDKDQQPKYNRN